MYIIKLDEFYVKIDEYENVEYTKEKESASVYEKISDASHVIEHCHISGALVDRV